MKNIYDVRRDNLKRILQDDFGNRQAALADKLKFEQPSLVSRLLSKKNIGSALARKIERVVDKPENWLDVDHTSELRQAAPLYGPDEHQPFMRALPVISWAYATQWLAVGDVFNKNETEELVPCPVECSPRSFALRVRGASMEPEFRDGWYIFVDPEVAPTNQSYVVAQVLGKPEALLRQLIIEGERRFLRTITPGWPEPIIEMDSNTSVIGVVIFKGTKV